MSMSETGCSHRWVVAFYDVTKDDEGDALDHVIAINNCRAVKETVEPVLMANPNLIAEATGSRFKNFTEWLSRGAQSGEGQGPES